MQVLNLKLFLEYMRASKFANSARFALRASQLNPSEDSRGNRGRLGAISWVPHPLFCKGAGFDFPARRAVFSGRTDTSPSQFQSQPPETEKTTTEYISGDL
jgi:hypothetical protein